MKRKSKILALLIIFPIIIFIIYGQIKSYIYEKELQKDGKITIGKLDSIEEYPKRTYLHISYYIGKIKYTSFESGLQKKISPKDIGKFYKIKYLSNSPEIIRGIYSEQIIDNMTILKAGFSKKDIEK
jgi:hypothetical protein